MEKQMTAGKKGYLRIALAGVLISALSYALMCGVFLNSYIVGSSMEPTLHEGERTMGLRMTFVQELQRGDIISFYPTVDSDGYLYVKRVIGLPGETVVIDDDRVYVDGEELTEPYIGEWTGNGTYEFHVPEGHCLVLGDNRDDSYDSRSWADPYVPYENIKAKSCFVYRADDGFHYLY